MARGKTVDVAAILGGQLAKVSESDTDMRWIETERILDNPLNFYPKPTNTQLAELMESIQANGLLEPPTVVPDGRSYRLLSGHSRMEAVRMLRDQNPEEPAYQKVLCRVMPSMDKDRELSAIIEANRQRIKSKALLAEEARLLMESYSRREKNGEKLKGRKRDRAAEALHVSPTTLANSLAIKNGIKVPGIMAKWERDEIPEAAALEIARLPVEAQYRLLDWVIDGHHSYSMRDVKKFATMWNGCLKSCPETGTFCDHAEAIYDQDFYGGVWHSPGCCRGCLKAKTCPAACHYAKQEQPEEHPPEPQVPSEDYGGGIAPPPKLENRVDWSADDWEQLCGRFSERLRTCREKTGLDRATFADQIGEYKATYSAWENGSLPGSGRLPKLAMTLGVSIDYLFGLTDDPSPRPAPVQSGQWQLLDKEHWPKAQQLVVISWANPLGGSYYETARCVGGYYDQYPFEDTDIGGELDEPAHGEYDIGYWWMPLPEKEDT